MIQPKESPGNNSHFPVWSERLVSLLAVLMCLAYFHGHWTEIANWWQGFPLIKSGWQGLLFRLSPLLSPLVSLTGWLTGGWFLLSLSSFTADPVIRLFLSWSLGCGLWALANLLMFWAGARNPLVYQALPLLFIVPGLFQARQIKQALFQALRSCCSGRFWTLALVLFLLFHTLAALAPVTGYDDQVYHLTIPGLMASSGQMQPRDMVPQVHKPFLGNLLYLWHAMIGGQWEISSQVTHLFCGFLACLGVAAIAGSLLGGGAAPAALALMAVPQFHIMAGTAYVDLIEMMFEAAFLLMLLGIFLGPIGNQGSSWFLTGLMGSFAGAVKYSFFYTLAAVVVVVLVLRYLLEESAESVRLPGPDARGLALLALGLGLVLVPFLVRSAVVTGNPLYPHFSSILGGSLPSQTSLPPLPRMVEGAGHEFFKSRFGPERDLVNTFAMPFLALCRSFIHSPQRSLEYFDGMLSPHLALGVLLLLLAMTGRGGCSDKPLFRAVATFVLLFTLTRFMIWLCGSLQVRFLFPLALLPCAFTGYFIEIGLGGERGENLPDMASAMAAICLILVTLFNLLFCLARLSWTDDFAYMTGARSREQILESRLPYMKAYGFLNSSLGGNERVKVLLEPRVFYLKAPFLWSSEIDLQTVNDIYGTDTPEEARERIVARGITHLAVPARAMGFLAGIIEDQEYGKRLAQLLKDCSTLVYSDTWGYVFRLDRRKSEKMSEPGNN